ncbi:ATP-grasp domain-containing protein [Sporosarcina sp. Te-1]|uniref:ATP-grasp domain-containing protein n=1 Tax=Sporosarcina sp. Te-1 TaxID=2818390 RepID=UPI001A9F1F46|nr:ATP-grasp domain-containing protein [Sporosarcina sp. Te-1]QTD42069.1 ATP-grasp domain-containing protein [Sporosarcina sp. Te-1]
MKSIVFIETVRYGAAKDALEASMELGYAPVLLTGKQSIAKEADQWHKNGLVYCIELSEDMIREVLDELLREGRQLQAIISFIDPYVSMAARLSNEYCQTALSANSMCCMEDKHRTRNALESLGVNPVYTTLAEDSLRTVSFPAVIKSSFSKASRDVYLLRTKKELEAACYKLTARQRDVVILLEEYVDGLQYIVEVIVNEGLPQIIAVVAQDVTDHGKFIVTGYSIGNVPPEEKWNQLQILLEQIVELLQVERASFHMELRLTSIGWKVIELNPRMAGFTMNQMIYEAYGINLAKEIVRLHIGEVPQLEKNRECAVYTYCMTTELCGFFHGVSGVMEAAAQSGVTSVQVHAKVGELIGPAMSMGQRYGYVMASGDNVEQARKRAMEAARLITFYIEEV